MVPAPIWTERGIRTSGCKMDADLHPIAENFSAIWDLIFGSPTAHTNQTHSREFSRHHSSPPSTGTPLISLPERFLFESKKPRTFHSLRAVLQASMTATISRPSAPAPTITISLRSLIGIRVSQDC